MRSGKRVLLTVEIFLYVLWLFKYIFWLSKFNVSIINWMYLAWIYIYLLTCLLGKNDFGYKQFQSKKWINNFFLIKRSWIILSQQLLNIKYSFRIFLPWYQENFSNMSKHFFYFIKEARFLKYRHFLFKKTFVFGYIQKFKFYLIIIFKDIKITHTFNKNIIKIK